MPLPVLQNRRTTSDEIADALREAILTGEFADGELLNQVALAKHFGVSRVPLREALRQLQAEGLVSAKAHQRAEVTGLDLERVLEILGLRLLIEDHLVASALPRMTVADVQRLEKLCKRMDETRDHQRWLELNRQFHDALCSPADAPFTVDLLGQLANRVERYLRVRTEKGIDRNEEANREHWTIVELIKSGDAARVRKELATHISHTRERVEAYFRDQAGRAGADSA